MSPVVVCWVEEKEKEIEASYVMTERVAEKRILYFIG